MRRRLLTLGIVLAVTAAVVVGLVQAGGRDRPASPAAAPFDLRAAREQLRGAPKPLAALHEQSGQLLPGGRGAFLRRLEALEGRPVVINKWASWCGPCRAEFPAFQAQATKRGREIAFLGVNSGDKTPAARRFLERYPVPYPSYEDPSEPIAGAIRAPANYPITVFLDARGETAMIHQGGYRDEADLAADIERYLDG